MQEFLANLVLYNTVAGNIESIKASYRYLIDTFGPLGVECVEGGKPIAPYLMMRKPGAHIDTWLYAHMDIVPAASDDQLILTSDGDQCFGRGVYDMKGAIAVYREVLQQDWPDTVGVIIVSDEEAGTHHGIKAFANDYLRGDELVIMPDGGGPEAIELAAKGTMWLELMADGVASHSSRPSEGENAIDKLLRQVEDLEQLVKPQNGSTEYSATTFVKTKIGGGRTHNMVPDVARVSLDIRYADGTIRKKVFEGLADSGLRYTTHLDILPFTANLHDQRVEACIGYLEASLGRAMDRVYSPGGSEAAFVASCGATPLVFYPRGGGSHGAGEFVYLSSLHSIAKALHSYLQNV